VTGASGGTGTLISQMLTSTDGVTQGTVTYRITPTANGCRSLQLLQAVSWMLSAAVMR
jgi:hypothetical protein